MKKIKRFAAVLTALALVSGVSATVFGGGGAVQYVSAVDAPADVIGSLSSEMRSHMTARETEFSIILPGEYLSSENVNAIISGALKDTGKCNEGDYLRWNLSKYSFSGRAVPEGYSIDFKVVYNSTAEEEKAVDEAVKKILSEIDTGSGSEYDKIAAAYDYVVGNVSYADIFDHTQTKVFTAYGAAVEGSAVCQGYTILLYRLLREMGINCRILPGTSGGGSHMWNIAEIGEEYYLLDSTFDSTLENSRGEYCFFLKGSDDFDQVFPDYAHVFAVQDPESPLLSELAEEDFLTRYPISEHEYHPVSVPAETTAATVQTTAATTTTTMVTTAPTGDTDPGTVSYILGDADGNGIVNAVDASLVLSAYAEQSTYDTNILSDIQQLAADVNKDGVIDSSDASSILSYYAYFSTGGQDPPENYFKQIGG